MTFQLRVATETDVTTSGAHFARAHADQWRPGSFSQVATIAGEVVGWGLRMANPVHPTHDPVVVEVRPEHRRLGVGTALVRALQSVADAPLTAKMATGERLSAAQEVQEHFLRSLGVHSYQRCPMVAFNPADPAVVQWCAEHRNPTGTDVEVVPGTALAESDYVAAFTTIYRWAHASWAPIAADAPLEHIVASWYADSNPERCFAIRRAGQLTAIVDALTTPDGADLPETMVLGEAVDPSVPTARRDVRSALAATIGALAGVGHEVSAEVHATDPNMWPLIAALPNLTVHGELHLVELR